jgi:L-fuculose-phosphate aldolase
MSERDLRARLIRIARRLDDKGILTATDGNVSIRLSSDALLITPSGSCKGTLEENDLVIAHTDGSVEGKGRPSSEIELHRTIYRLRHDVNAVVHAHPPHATAFAVAGIALDQPILSEVVLTLGTAPIVPYALPTGGELARSVEPFLVNHRALLLRFHGVVTFDATIEAAAHLMETVEHVAQIELVRRQLGSNALLPKAEVERLEQLRKDLLAGR